MGGSSIFQVLIFVPILVLIALVLKSPLQKSLSGVGLVLASVFGAFLLSMIAFVLMVKGQYGAENSIETFIEKFFFVTLIVAVVWAVKVGREAKK